MILQKHQSNKYYVHVQEMQWYWNENYIIWNASRVCMCTLSTVGVNCWNTCDNPVTPIQRKRTHKGAQNYLLQNILIRYIKSRMIWINIKKIILTSKAHNWQRTEDTSPKFTWDRRFCSGMWPNLGGYFVEKAEIKLGVNSVYVRKDAD